MDDLLTTKEIKTAMGLTENDATAAYIHGLSDFMAVCKAQSAKTKAALVAEGWKSPQDVASIINALTDAFKWNISGEIADARADERKAIGEQLHWALEISPKVIPQYVNTLLKGESPNG
jgi:hypothetical protein